jgi:hypothetical protein
MKLRTAGVRDLVSEVLGSMPKPYTEDVIAHVFRGIEQNVEWRARYDQLCGELTKTVVNNWCGFWTERLLGGTAIREVSTKGGLSESYSKLSLDGHTSLRHPAPTRKSTPGTAGTRTKQQVSEAAAAQLMSDYFQEHKTELPPSIRKYRERIIELLTTGASPEEAFSTVLTLDRGKQ